MLVSAIGWQTRLLLSRIPEKAVFRSLQYANVDALFKRMELLQSRQAIVSKGMRRLLLSDRAW